MNDQGPETTPIKYLRSEDLLDDSSPERLARSFGLSRRRQLTGLVVALLLLPLLTLLLDALRDELALDAQVLVYLLAVVVIAMIGGVVVAVASAIASALLINYFFVDPIHTFTVGDPDQVVTLVVFAVVAALVSGAYELAVRRAQAAERARAEAEAMAGIAGPKLEEKGSLHEVLSRARETFRMESVALKVRERGTGEWIEADHVGWAPVGTEASLRFDVPVGAHIRLVGRGPALFAEDQRVLEAFARAAATAYQGKMLSGEAEEARTLATVDQQRTSLLAAVGHDLRTPLAGIKAAVTSLRQTDVQWSEREREELLQTIEESADRLEGVVSNLLDASRLRAGALSVKLEGVALDEVVAGALLAVPDAAGRVRIEVAEDLPLVRADRGLLQRVLVNVIDNALHHGASDEPVEVLAIAGGESARVEVVDHGRGISSEQQELIFEPFQRRDDYGGDGLGLGLSVARGFVEAMGGAMVADSTPGGGLTMRIRLQLASAHKADTASPAT
jgi:two-component system sensor histidine kinase KdpD